jgi:hypothetical protein
MSLGQVATRNAAAAASFEWVRTNALKIAIANITEAPIGNHLVL